MRNTPRGTGITQNLNHSSSFVFTMGTLLPTISFKLYQSSEFLVCRCSREPQISLMIIKSCRQSSDHKTTRSRSSFSPHRLTWWFWVASSAENAASCLCRWAAAPTVYTEPPAGGAPGAPVSARPQTALKTGQCPSWWAAHLCPEPDEDTQKKPG